MDLAALMAVWKKKFVLATDMTSTLRTRKGSRMQGWKPWVLLKQTLAEWKEDDASRYAAALAFYTAISVAPLLVMVVVLVGLLGGTEREARAQMFSVALYFMGPQAAEFLDMVVKNADKPVAGSITGLVSLLTLVWGSTNVFTHLQTALNRIWGAPDAASGGIFHTIRTRLLSFALVFALAYLLLVSLIFSTVLSAWTDSVGGALPGLEAIWGVVEILVSFALFTLLFAGVFKLVPDTPIAWRDVWLGAAVTSLFFSIGKFALTYYLGRMDSTYGAAGSLIAFLLWVYYSAQILFFGAEFTQVYARRKRMDEPPISPAEEPAENDDVIVTL